MVGQGEHNILQGIAISLKKRKILKCQHRLGNGHDAELHATIADLYKHLGEQHLAVESYKLAANSLLKKGTALETDRSNDLIQTYKNILSLAPDDDVMADALGREYQRRGMQYRAMALHTSLAEHAVQRGDYQKAIGQYQRVLEIEPTSMTARQMCAELYSRIGAYQQGAREYAHIGDLYFERQKFDGALEYYRRASDLAPKDVEISQKMLFTQQILDGAIIPHQQPLMYVTEEQTTRTLEQLHAELCQQCTIETSFVERLHESLQEIVRLLQTQEQEIHALEHLSL
jgi:tetratricopeptide (TPR) repeat protein